jgi:hypothetical protein
MYRIGPLEPEDHFLVNGVNDLIAGGVDLGGQSNALPVTFKTVCFKRPLAVKTKTDFAAPNSHRI